MTPSPAQTRCGGCMGSVSHHCRLLLLCPMPPFSPADLCLPGRTRSRTCSDGPSCTLSTASSREWGRRGWRGRSLGPLCHPTQACGWTCRPCEPSWRGPSSWTPCASTASVRSGPPPLQRAGPVPPAGAALPAAQPFHALLVICLSPAPLQQNPWVFIAAFCMGS